MKPSQLSATFELIFKSIQDKAEKEGAQYAPGSIHLTHKKTVLVMCYEWMAEWMSTVGELKINCLKLK